MKEALTYSALIMAALGLALNAWAFLRARLTPEEAEREDRAERGAFEAIGELLRAELLAGGRGKHHAYHVTEDGVLLAVDAVDMYLACLAGLDEFWDVVAASGGGRGNPFAVSLDEIDLGDGKGDFTYVYNRCGEAFVDAGGPLPPPYAHDSARATADDFKNAVVHAQAEAAERERSCYANAFHRR